MPSPEKKQERSSLKRENKPDCLTIPERVSDHSSTSPSPSLPQTSDQDLSPTSPKWIDDDTGPIDTGDDSRASDDVRDIKTDKEDEDEDDVDAKLVPVKDDDDKSIDKEVDEIDEEHEVRKVDELDIKVEECDSVPVTPQTPKKGSLISLGKKKTSRRKGKCSKCAQESSDKRKSWKLRGKEENHNSCKGAQSHCKGSRKSTKNATTDAPMSPRTRDLSDKKRVPGSPRRSERSRSKQEQLQDRHLERRIQHECGHKKLAKKEHDLKSERDLIDSDEDDSIMEECHKQSHYHKVPHRARSERRCSHRSRSSSVSSRRSCELPPDGDDNLSFTVPNRWLSYDRLSQTSDCGEHGVNGSTIHLEYPYKPSNNQGIYISPYFSAAYRAPGAEILIASLIMIVGVVALITHYATGQQIWMLVGGICLGLGGMFMLLGLCWYCALSTQKKEDHAVQVKIKKLKEKLRLERSPSDGLSQVKSEIQMV